MMSLKPAVKSGSEPPPQQQQQQREGGCLERKLRDLGEARARALVTPEEFRGLRARLLEAFLEA
jgi:hypothetical protein